VATETEYFILPMLNKTY